MSDTPEVSKEERLVGLRVSEVTVCSAWLLLGLWCRWHGKNTVTPAESEKRPLQGLSSSHLTSFSWYVRLSLLYYQPESSLQRALLGDSKIQTVIASFLSFKVCVGTAAPSSFSKSNLFGILCWILLGNELSSVPTSCPVSVSSCLLSCRSWRCSPRMTS